MPMLLDRFLPDYEISEFHSLRIDAPPDAVMRAARGLRPRELPLSVALMALRMVPALVRRRGPGLSLERPVIDQFVSAGFVLLAEEADELVVGGVGRFWSADGGVRRVARREFADFDEPGFAKSAFNLRVTHSAGRTVLSTETRIKGTDEAARRGFRRYWRLVSPGSAAIRREWLRAIRRRAERSA